MPTYSIMLHIMNEDPIMGEVDKLPDASDYLILVKNPRRRDGKDLITWIVMYPRRCIWPITRINFIEIIPTGEDEQIISFVRE